jgi:hypothetical protein
VDTSHKAALSEGGKMKLVYQWFLGRQHEILIDVDLQLAICALDAQIGWLAWFGHLLLSDVAPRPDQILRRLVFKVNPAVHRPVVRCD